MYQSTFLAEQDARLRREEAQRRAAERASAHEARLLLRQTAADSLTRRLTDLARRFKRTRPVAESATDTAPIQG